ncbi:MAG: hypothetical protein Q8Q38_02505 [bacterium]|nr:hypothetical protein [bacterium]MDZ4231758.1 hypothetical protein [Candidatus Pacearchaeota archaeon]
MLEVKKQDRETTQSLIRRFSRRMKNSGILMRARAIRFRDRSKSIATKKHAALRRIEKRTEFEKLEKIGKVPQRSRGRRR